MMNLALTPEGTFSYEQFKKSFPYQDDALYSMIFKRNSDLIGLSREKFAVKNLKRIFDTTFKLTSKIGFQAMTLRDLSKETGLSMGGIYSTIGSKENIAIMMKDVVVAFNEELMREVGSMDDSKAALERLVKGDLYGSTLLQPWFCFLYFETRSLPRAHQEDSKNIERTQILELERLIDETWNISDGVIPAGFVASTILSLIQEHYLKPWKYEYSNRAVDAYAQQCLDLLHCWGINSKKT